MINLTKTLILGMAFAILLIPPSACWAQAPDTLWTRYFNYSDPGYREECFRLIQTLNDGFLSEDKHSVFGDDQRQQFEDYYLMKTNSNGIEEWSKGFQITSRHDILGGIAQDVNGQYRISGAADNARYSNITKIDSNGDSLLTNNFGTGKFKDGFMSVDGGWCASSRNT